MRLIKPLESDFTYWLGKSVLFPLVVIAILAPRSPAQWVLEGPASDRARQMVVPVPAGTTLDPAASWELVDVDDSHQRWPLQLGPAVAADGTRHPSQQLWLATIPASPPDQSTRRFQLLKSSDAVQRPAAFRFVERDERSLDVLEGDQPVMSYNFGVITDPAVPAHDHRRSRACYIHPIWGLQGEILTDDFPRDHYHHHGVFWSWPYVRIDGQTYDLWIYSNIQQRFVGWLHRQADHAAARIGVENGWYVNDRQVMTERVWISAYRAEEDSRSIDISLTLIATDRPVTLQGADLKSYGGLTFRFDVLPRTDSTVRVPGRTLEPGEDLLNTPLAWVDLASRFPDAPRRSGASVFIHPDHPDYPPAWLTRHYGALCVGWPGLEPQTLQPGQPVTLEYRLWIHRHEPGPEEIGHVYSSYRQSQPGDWRLQSLPLE
jgi:hypothetical protein